MKLINNIFKIALVALPMVTMAQVDRSKPPKPLPAKAINIPKPANFTLPNGLKVIVVRNTKLPKVSATLTIERGAIFEGDKAGYVEMAGQMMMRGTKKYTKAQLDEEVDLLGGSLNASSSNAFASALTTNFEKMFALMAEVALSPNFNADELEKIRKQTLSGLEQQKEDANSIARNVSGALMYGLKHPYGEVETIETVKKVTLEDVKKYYATYWKPNISYLVFVGDISVDGAKALATKYFGKWVKGNVVKPTYAFPTVTQKPIIALVDRPQSVQSVINIVSPITLKPGDGNVIPSRIMSAVLGGGSNGRLYKNLRETRGFTYGAYSNISSDKLVGSFRASASVRNEKTDSAVGEFINEFNKIRKTPATEEEVMLVRKEIAGNFSRSLEQPETIADFALTTAVNNLPPNYYDNYVKNVEAVTPAVVQQMANTYIKPNNLYMVIVGNAKQIADGLEKYGEVKYFDIYGNPTKAPASGKAVDANITGKSIIEAAVKAHGGTEALAAIKDITINGKAEIPGAPMQFDVTQKYLMPNYFSSTMGSGPMVVMKQLVKGDKFEQEQQGQKQDLTDEDKEEMAEETTLINEVYYLKNNYTFTVGSIETIDGKEAYKVDIKSAKGREFTNYYEVATGLKIKSTKQVDGPQGQKMLMGNSFSDFKAINGINIPYKTVLDVGIKITITVSDAKVNTGLKESDF